MFDFDSGLDLELGSRRRPVKWAVELSLADCRPQKHKARRRQQAAHSAPSEEEASKQQNQQQHNAHLQQHAQQQRVAAHRKHLEQLALMQRQDPAEVTPAQAKYMKEFRDSSVVCLSTEIEQGNVEYKYRLTGCVTNENRRHQLITQMKFRLSEGSGECFYYLGVEDDGYPRGLDTQALQESMAVIHHMAVSLQATARLVEYVAGGFGRTAALMHIKANATEDMRLTDSRVAVAGSMDSGKSTLVAVLTHGADGRPLLDNGRGSARMAVFRHKHEIESGRTSSISQQVLGYDEEGRVLNYVGVATPTPADITAAASHMVNFIDMGGHEKYLKTTLYGMTCLLPDYALLCVDAGTGLTRITREHLAVAVALEVPTAIVVTKADAVDDQQLQQVLQQLHALMQPVLSNCLLLQQQQQEVYAPQQQQGQVHAQCQQEEQGRQQHQVQAPHPLGGEDSSRHTTTTISAASTSSSDNQHSITSSSTVHSMEPGVPAPACHMAWGTPSGVPVVQSEQQAISLAASLSELHSCTAAPAAPSFQQAVFPVFVVSCVSGAGIHLLHAFLSRLRSLQVHKQEQRRGCGLERKQEIAGRQEQQHEQQQERQQEQQREFERGSGVVDAAIASTAAQQGCAAACTTATAEEVFGTGGGTAFAESPVQQQQQPATKQMTPSRDGSSQLWGVSPHKHKGVPGICAATEAALGTAATAAAAAAGSLGQSSAPCADDAAGVSDEREEVCRPGHFQVVHTYDVEGVGWVVSGIAVTGTIEVGQSLLWGPTPEGGFSPVRVTCIQRSHVPVRHIAPGQTATLALQALTGGLPHSGSKQALLTAAAVAQAAAAEAAAREAAAAIAAVPEPIAKTRRRSPAALKAAAAAAASTAATAAAAAHAARRAAETAGGKAWWVPAAQQQQQQQQRAPGMEQQQGGAARSAPLFSACADPSAAAAEAHSSSIAGTAADYVGDLMADVDLAAVLAAEDSGSEGEADLFGSLDDQPGACSSTAATASLADTAVAEAGTGEDDIFAGLVDVFEDGDGVVDVDADELPSPGRDNSSTTSSTDGLLSKSWSFSSASSTCGIAAAASSGCTSRYASSASRCASSTAAAAPATAQPIAISSGHSVLANRMRSGGSGNDAALFGCSPSRMRNKGGVLLDAAAVPHTYWEFEALLVLLGGHWPARGLLSGCWPPEAAADGADGAPGQRDVSATAAGESLGTLGTLDHTQSPQQGDSVGQMLLKHQVDGQPQALQLQQTDEQVKPQQQQAATQRGRKQRSSNKRFDFAYVVHCNSIRQIARVVCMRELRQHAVVEEADSDNVHSSSREDGTVHPTEPTGNAIAEHELRDVQQHCGLTASIRAAAALLQGASSAPASSDKELSHDSASGDSSSGGDSGGGRQRLRARVTAAAGSSGHQHCSDAGSVVSVRFRFTHRPEWMQAGARMIVRDRSDGHVAAAGFVTQLLQPHVHLQQHQKDGVGAQSC